MDRGARRGAGVHGGAESDTTEPVSTACVGTTTFTTDELNFHDLELDNDLSTPMVLVQYSGNRKRKKSIGLD